MTLEELRVFKKEQPGNTEGDMIICSRSRREAPARLTEEEAKGLEDMARFFLDKKNKRKDGGAR